MTSYPLWQPEPAPEPAESSAQPATVEITGRVAEIDRDESSIEIETTGEGSDDWIHVEFNDETVVYSSAARDESAEGAEGLDLLKEGDEVRLSAITPDDETFVALGVTLLGNEISTTSKRPVPAHSFQPRDRVPGIVRSIDTGLGRIVLETVEHGMIAVYCDGDTPVFFHGGIFRISNLEVGDGVIVTIGATDEGDPATPWVTAIDVTRSVSHDGPSPAARKPMAPVLPPANLLLDVIEVEGTVKRVEAQGFEIEAADGELRYVTADPQMAVACARVERVDDIKPGLKIRVRVFEVGDRLVAQRITLLD